MAWLKSESFSVVDAAVSPPFGEGFPDASWEAVSDSPFVELLFLFRPKTCVYCIKVKGRCWDPISREYTHNPRSNAALDCLKPTVC